MFMVQLAVEALDGTRFKEIALPFAPVEGLRILDGDNFLTVMNVLWIVDSRNFMCGVEPDFELEILDLDGWILPDEADIED